MKSVTLTVEKGVALVVLHKIEYINQAQELLKGGGTYKEIKTDPTSKYRT